MRFRVWRDNTEGEELDLHVANPMQINWEHHLFFPVYCQEHSPMWSYPCPGSRFSWPWTTQIWTVSVHLYVINSTPEGQRYVDSGNKCQVRKKTIEIEQHRTLMSGMSAEAFYFSRLYLTSLTTWILLWSGDHREMEQWKRNLYFLNVKKKKNQTLFLKS